MKKWTKLHYELLKDPRVQKLIKELAMKGFGTYIILLLLLDCEATYTKDVLATRAMKYTGKRLALKVIEGYGLFEEDDDGFLRVSVHASVRASERTGERVSVHASEPFNKKEREENKNKSCSSINDHHDNKPFSKPSFLDVSRYCEEHDYSINIKKFYTYYESKGWKVGRYVTDDWKALVDNWAIRDLEKACAKNDSYDETSYINDAY